MKRFSLIALVLLLTWAMAGPLPASAYTYGFGPERYENNLTYGIGVFFAPHDTVIYERPDALSPVVEHFEWRSGNDNVALFSRKRQQLVKPGNYFLAFYPKLEVAVMPVLTENGQGWAQVVYDQRRQKTGWVRLRELLPEDMIDDWPNHLAQFQTWLDFMKYNGRAAGIYWLTGVSDYHKQLRTSPDDKAKLIELQMIRRLDVKHIRGNWLLVEVMDFNRSTPIGWVRWRDKNGRLMVFPNLSKRKAPYMMGFF